MKPEDYLKEIVHQYGIYDSYKKKVYFTSKPLENGDITTIEDRTEVAVIPLSELEKLLKEVKEQ